ncbi:MAG TPA: D-tyrosyl-tRNA(Tyr) deacylase [Methanocorpusculum sp.]|nr:D-tyrosyl-tRNA(Tyr) deacylase [Methanocorpusculum sp.]
MIIDILNSDSDPAGRNIRKAIDLLTEENGKKEYPLYKNEVTFHTIPGRIVYAKKTDVNKDADLIIVISRHSSVNPVPVLTVHATGNYGIAQLGGNDAELGLTSPAWMKSILKNHEKFVPQGYRISYEITHHGPTDFDAPFFFVEVGSTEKEWNDEKAYTAAAKSVLYAEPVTDCIPLIGFGGTHYAVRQTAIGLETKGAFGHIMHTRDTANANADIVKQMADKSGGITAAHIDKKSMSKSEAANIKNILDRLGIIEITEGDLHILNQMSYETWKSFSKFSKDVKKDIRIFPHGNIDSGTPAIVKIPEELFNLTFFKDETLLFEKLDEIGGVFHSTTSSGKILPIFFTAAENQNDVSSYLIGFAVQQLTRTQDCLVEGDSIVVTRRQFDAGSARKTGVPSGPMYGILAAGKSVTLEDGRTITPEMVTKTIKTTIKIPGLE